jgi:hypothetical protein
MRGFVLRRGSGEVARKAVSPLRSATAVQSSCFGLFGFEIVGDIQFVGFEGFDGFYEAWFSVLLEPVGGTPWVLIRLQNKAVVHGVVVNIFQARVVGIFER